MAAWIQLLPALQLFRHKTEGQLSVQGQRWVARNGLMDGDHAGKYLPPGCAPEVLQQLTDSREYADAKSMVCRARVADAPSCLGDVGPRLVLISLCLQSPEVTSGH